MITVIREDDPDDAPDRPPIYFLEYVGAEQSILAEKQIRDVRLKKSRVPFDRETAESVGIVWRKLLREVRYPEKPRWGADGTIYHFSRGVFSSNEERHELSWGLEKGQVWSPKNGTMPAELVAIGKQMKEYALSAPDVREKSLVQLRENVERLKTKLDRREVRK